MPKYNVLPAKLPEIFFNVSVTYVNHTSASSVARTHNLSSLQQALNRRKPELPPQCLGPIFFLSQSLSFAKAKIKSHSHESHQRFALGVRTAPFSAHIGL